MEAKFKCCRKDFTNYICIVCLSPFHPSCLERKSSVIKLGRYRVYCSEHCQGEDQAREEREGKLIEELKRAETGSREKDAFIERLKKNSRDFEDDVVAVEGKYAEELMRHKNMAVNLKRELDGLRLENDRWQREFGEKEQLVERLERDISELTVLNRDMISTIRTLEEVNEMHLSECNRLRVSMLTSTETLTEENRACTDELRQIKCDSFSSKNSNKTYKKLSLMPVVTWESGGLNKSKVGQSHSVEAVLDAGVDLEKGGCIGDAAEDASRVGMGADVVTLRQGTLDRKCRVLILCDESGRYICNQLRQTLNSGQFSVESIIKPNARLEDVVENMDKLAKDFSTRDYVIVMAGKNNFSEKKYPKFRFISDRLRSCSTNVIFVSTPVYIHNRDLCKNILKFNNRLNGFLQKINNLVPCNLAYIEANGLDGLKLERRKVLDKIQKEITVQKRASKNLIFIDTVNTPLGVGGSRSASNSDSCVEREFFR